MVVLEARESRAAAESREYFDKLRFEEVSDVAERLSYAIDVTIDYELRGDHLYALSDRKERPFYEQTAEAIRIGQYDYVGDKAFQMERLQLEHLEALEVDAFARGEMDGNVYMKFSKVPDAVVDGSTTINGYRRDILRSFARIYERHGSRVTCRIISLDQNNSAGMEAVGDLMQIELNGRSSEASLADSTIVDTPDATEFVEEIVDRIKLSYDDAIMSDTGVRTHAGSLLPNSFDAHSLVMRQTDLVQSHILAVDRILHSQLNEAARNQLLEIERKRTAAAVRLNLNGANLTSNGDGAVTTEVSSNNYDGDCPTAKNGMNQASEDLSKDWVKVVESCPNCHASKIVAVKTGEIIKGVECGCWVNVCTGERFVGGIEKQTAQNSNDTKSEILPAERVISKQKQIERIFGAQALFVQRIVIGGVQNQVYDSRSGDLIQEDFSFKQSQYALAA